MRIVSTMLECKQYVLQYEKTKTGVFCHTLSDTSSCAVAFNIIPCLAVLLNATKTLKIMPKIPLMPTT